MITIDKLMSKVREAPKPSSRCLTGKTTDRVPSAPPSSVSIILSSSARSLKRKGSQSQLLITVEIIVDVSAFRP